MAGGSSYYDDYANQLRAQQNENIRLLGWVSGATCAELIANALLFVLPSDLEGLSVAPLEAMGSGVCVLTSDIPENREVVEGAGFTFEHGDAVDLERMMRLLLSDSQVRIAAARRGQQRVRERYMWRSVADNVDRIYQKVMGAAPVEERLPAESAA